MALFFEKWLQDLKYEQSLGEGVPTTVPNILGPGGGIAIWHDAGVIVPWRLYETYGDLQLLEGQFDSMKATVDFYTERVADRGSGLIESGQQLGDWVSMDVPRGPMLNYRGEIWNLQLNEKMGATDPYFVANVYYANSALLTAKAAAVLGSEEDVRKYQALHDTLTEAIRREYVTPNGRIVNDTQTANVLALHFGVVEEKDRAVCMERLLANLKRHRNHLTTGFAGTPFLCPVLSENGRHEVAGTVFLKDDCPSWLYPVGLGATTMWELWDGVNPDGSFNGFEMNSLNHYSYGSIGGWVYHDLLGIKLLEPGYKKSRIAPRLIVGIPEIEGRIETIYGRLTCKIVCARGRYVVDLDIPANTTAEVALPEREEVLLGSGVYHFEYATEHDFAPKKFNMETTFGALMAHPEGAATMNRYAKELVDNELFMMFAAERPVLELEGTLPPAAMDVIQMALDACNDTEQRLSPRPSYEPNPSD
nr:alpha-L-rhamnosidase C-terminal domain-containing protein [Actinomyces ruminis]